MEARLPGTSTRCRGIAIVNAAPAPYGAKQGTRIADPDGRQTGGSRPAVDSNEGQEESVHRKEPDRCDRPDHPYQRTIDGSLMRCNDVPRPVGWQSG